MLSTVDILNLIRLTELEINKLQKEIECSDAEKRDAAGEVIVQFDTMANKLKNMYLASNPNYDIHPPYEEYIRLITE